MESRIALETGMHSPWVSRVLSELGHPDSSSRQYQLDRSPRSNPIVRFACDPPAPLSPKLCWLFYFACCGSRF